jgi:hypothetical protein
MRSAGLPCCLPTLAKHSPQTGQMHRMHAPPKQQRSLVRLLKQLPAAASTLFRRRGQNSSHGAGAPSIDGEAGIHTAALQSQQRWRTTEWSPAAAQTHPCPGVQTHRPTPPPLRWLSANRVSSAGAAAAGGPLSTANPHAADHWQAAAAQYSGWCRSRCQLRYRTYCNHAADPLARTHSVQPGPAATVAWHCLLQLPVPQHAAVLYTPCRAAVRPGTPQHGQKTCNER